jgi:Flp pilus assembly protein TadB/Mg-chelatase subunit ChlD
MDLSGAEQRVTRRLRRTCLPVVVLVCILNPLLTGTPASAAAKPALIISGLETQAGVIRFTLTARSLPDTVTLDPAAVRVRAGQAPLRSEATATTTAKDAPSRALMVVVDATSRVSAGQLAAARAAFGALAAALPPDVQLGLVSVSTSASTVLAPTRDRGVFTAALAGLAAGGTAAIAGGVTTASAALRSAGINPDSDRRVVVFSDGKGLTSGLTDALRSSLVAEDLPVDVVAFASNASASARLKTFADATGGRFVAADDVASAIQGALSEGRAFPGALAVTAFVPHELAGVTSTMDVSIEGSGVSTSTLVTFGAAVPAPHATEPAQGAAGEPAPGAAGVTALGWMPPLLAYVFGAAVFVGVLVVVLALAWPRSMKRERIKQIAHFGPSRKASAPKQENASAGGVILRTALAATASLVRWGGMEQRISLRLARAGMRLRAHEWVLLRICITAGIAALLFAVASWPGALMGLALGWLLTVLYLSIRLDRRSTMFAEQLPDALQLVIGSLKSGFSLPQALDSLVRESPDPVAAEFGRALAEHRLGVDVADAIERLAYRTQSDDLGWAVMAVRIQREVGGNLAEVLQNTVDTMRERSRLRRHVRSLSAEGRISAWVLIGLPIGLSAFMLFFRPNYLAPLFRDPTGVTMVIAGGLLFVVGIFWMTRVIKVEA